MTDFIAICHGRTEVILARWISQQSRVKILVDAKNDGKQAIMLNNLIAFMKDNGYYNESRLKRRFRDIEYKHEKGLKDLRIFIIMDVDVDRRTANDFLTKKIFEECPLYDHIVPILSDRSLDDVMNSIDLPIASYNKLDDYKQALYSITVDDLYDMLRGRKDTNLGDMIAEILEHSEDHQCKDWK